jgi:hypothetical protein
MIKVSASVDINCSCETLFHVSADPYQQLKWDAPNFKNVTALTPGPIGKGSAYKCVIRCLGTMQYEFAEYEPCNFFAHRSKMFLTYGYHRFEFVRLPQGTRLIQTMQVWPRGIGILFYPFMKRMTQKQLDSVGTGLKSFLEDHP